jgi:hypothetical protein
LIQLRATPESIAANPCVTSAGPIQPGTVETSKFDVHPPSPIGGMIAHTGRWELVLELGPDETSASRQIDANGFDRSEKNG